MACGTLLMTLERRGMGGGGGWALFIFTTLSFCIFFCIALYITLVFLCMCLCACVCVRVFTGGCYRRAVEWWGGSAQLQLLQLQPLPRGKGAGHFQCLPRSKVHPHWGHQVVPAAVGAAAVALT